MKEMKKRLGISIYPEIVGAEETIKYLDQAKKHGFERVFANLLEVENDAEGKKKLDMLSSVYKHAKDLGLEMIVDVNPRFYKSFNLPNTEVDFFLGLNVTGIRLDGDFKGEVESILSNNKKGLKIELNASNNTETFDKTLEKGGNINNLYMCHNFYPMRNTGLDRDRFMILSAHFKALGARVAAWVTLPEEQKGVGPWDVNEGMPTLEEHRDMSIEGQTFDLLATGVVDDIIISQQAATERQLEELGNTLKAFNDSVKAKSITIAIDPLEDITDVEKEIIFDFTFPEEFKKMWKVEVEGHVNRVDINSQFIRSTMPRIVYKEADIPAHNNKKELKVGDVVILNDSIGRYKGELHIITKDMLDSNNSRNLVGKVKPADINKIKLVSPGKEFKLIK